MNAATDLARHAAGDIAREGHYRLDRTHTAVDCPHCGDVITCGHKAHAPDKVRLIGLALIAHVHLLTIHADDGVIA